MDLFDDAKQRMQFFEGLLAKLHSAANSGYSSLKNQCHDTQTTVNGTYPNLPKFPDISMLHALEQDSYSKTVIPSDVPERLVPLKCYGDGNCLFRAASIHVCGRQDMYTELRVRTVCELVGYEEYYLRPEVTSFHGGFVDDQMCCGRLHATSANYDSPHLQQDPSGSTLEQQIFILDCLDTTKDGTYCNMSHIHALSSVLKCKIRSIYPDYNHYVRPLLNKEVSPRQGICNNPCDKPVYIMWTRTVPMVECSWWSPNHFVPCIPTLSENRQSLSHCAANVSSRLLTSDLATTTVGSKSSFKHAGQQLSDLDNLTAYVTKASSNPSQVIITSSTSDKQNKLQQCMQTSTRSSSTDTSSKPLPTVSSILLLARKKHIFPKEKTGSGSIKSFFKGATGKISSLVGNTSVLRTTHTLQQKLQPQEPTLTQCKNEQSTQHNQSCAHVQPFPPTSTCASTLTKIHDASSIHIPTSGSTFGEVPTTLISNGKSSLKESSQSHRKFPSSVSSILLLSPKKKVCSQGNQSLLDLLQNTKQPLESTSKSNSSDVGNNSPEREMQDLEFGTDDHSLHCQETSLNSDTDSYIDDDDSFTLHVASDSDSSDTDNSPKIQPIESVNSQMEISDSLISDTDSHIDSTPNAESDVEPFSDVCEVQHSSQESHVSHHLIRHNDELLPFPNLSRSWYVKEQKIHNKTRDTLRRLNPIERDGTNTILCMNRSQVQGSFRRKFNIFTAEVE